MASLYATLIILGREQKRNGSFLLLWNWCQYQKLQLSSFLDFEGKYNPHKRFVISNWTDEDFNSFWDGQPISIPKGEMKEFEHAVAYKLCKELVDREMFKEAERLWREAGGNEKAFAEKVRERAEMATLSPQLRKPYEDKTVFEVKAGEESPVMAKMRAEIRAEEQAKISNEFAVTPKAVIPTDLADVTDAEVTPKKGRPRSKGEFEEKAETK